MKTSNRWVVVELVAVLMLAACGGGSDATPAVTPTASATPSTGSDAAAGSGGTSGTSGSAGAGTTTQASQTPTPNQPVAQADCGLSGLAVAILDKLNAERARGASCGTRGSFASTTAVSWNTKLELAAIGHSNDMVANNFFSHTSANGRTLADRVNETGYAWSRLGENIAAGFFSADSVVAAWMASDGHCANMMNPAFREVGLACVRGSNATSYGNYWTLNFGTALN